MPKLWKQKLFIGGCLAENKPEDNLRVVFGIRPEDIALNSNSSKTIQAKVELIEPMGSDTLIWASIEKTPISIRIEGSANFELEDEIEMNINISRASIFDKMSEERI